MGSLPLFIDTTYKNKTSEERWYDLTNKKIGLLDNKNYNIKIIGLDNCKINFSLFKYDSNGNIVDSYKYENIEVKPQTVINTVTVFKNPKLKVDGKLFTPIK